MWIKYRVNWSSRYGKWDYRKFEGKSALDEFLEDTNNEWNYSEHYRGIDYEIVEYRDKEFVIKQLEHKKKRIKEYILEMRTLEDELRQINTVQEREEKTI